MQRANGIKPNTLITTSVICPRLNSKSFQKGVSAFLFRGVNVGGIIMWFLLLVRLRIWLLFCFSKVYITKGLFLGCRFEFSG